MSLIRATQCIMWNGSFFNFYMTTVQLRSFVLYAALFLWFQSLFPGLLWVGLGWVGIQVHQIESFVRHCQISSLQERSTRSTALLVLPTTSRASNAVFTRSDTEEFRCRKRRLLRRWHRSFHPALAEFGMALRVLSVVQLTEEFVYAVVSIDGHPFQRRLGLTLAITSCLSLVS